MRAPLLRHAEKAVTASVDVLQDITILRRCCVRHLGETDAQNLLADFAARAEGYVEESECWLDHYLHGGRRRQA